MWNKFMWGMTLTAMLLVPLSTQAADNGNWDDGWAYFEINAGASGAVAADDGAETESCLFGVMHYGSPCNCIPVPPDDGEFTGECVNPFGGDGDLLKGVAKYFSGNYVFSNGLPIDPDDESCTCPCPDIDHDFCEYPIDGKSHYACQCPKCGTCSGGTSSSSSGTQFKAGLASNSMYSGMLLGTRTMVANGDDGPPNDHHVQVLCGGGCNTCFNDPSLLGTLLSYFPLNLLNLTPKDVHTATICPDCETCAFKNGRAKHCGHGRCGDDGHADECGGTFGTGCVDACYARRHIIVFECEHFICGTNCNLCKSCGVEVADATQGCRSCWVWLEAEVKCNGGCRANLPHRENVKCLGCDIYNCAKVAAGDFMCARCDEGGGDRCCKTKCEPKRDHCLKECNGQWPSCKEEEEEDEEDEDPGAF